MLKIDSLIDDAKCYQSVRQMRWPAGVRCVWCKSDNLKRRGMHQRQRERQRYHCHACDRDFDDLTLTIFAHHHQPLRKWIVCLYLLGLNRSNEQIAQGLDLNKDDVHQMTVQLRSGVVALKPEPQLQGTVECDEVYVVAGHKGYPEAVKKRGAPDTTTTKRCPRARHAGERETSGLRDDATGHLAREVTALPRIL